MSSTHLLIHCRIHIFWIVWVERAWPNQSFSRSSNRCSDAFRVSRIVYPSLTIHLLLQLASERFVIVNSTIRLVCTWR